jgi:DNA-binding PadR family transcriptional regulator
MPVPENREFRLAFCKLHVLHHAAEGPIYALWMLKELAEHGHVLSPGTLYPLLARMEKNGWLRSGSRGSAKERKNYRITPSRRRLLKQLRGEVEELYRELVLGEEPEGAHP